MKSYHFLLVAMLFLAFGTAAQKSKIVLVIDPGHGGHDPGHLSGNPALKTEKELNLIIAQKVGKYIEQYLDNVEVIFTRQDDTYPSLNDRVEMANIKKADYFLSIHCNGSDNSAIHGTESHVHNYDARNSVEWATIMEKEFARRAGRHSRGLKTTDDREHSLQVLKYTRMTSLLVECGFLTHGSEAAYLNTVYGQDIIASAIFRAFRTTVQAQYPEVEILKSRTAKESSSGSHYAVQIHSSKEWIDTEDKIFKGLEDEVTRKESPATSSGYRYRYLVGNYDSKEEAAEMMEKARSKGFRDAFIVKTD